MWDRSPIILHCMEKCIGSGSFVLLLGIMEEIKSAVLVLQSAMGFIFNCHFISDSVV